MESPSQIPQIIASEWGLDASLHSKEEIVAAITQRIRQMLGDDPMAFIQLMYRLDISEVQLDAAMNSPDAAIIVAQLVWDRQVQKQLLRTTTRPPEVADDDLLW